MNNTSVPKPIEFLLSVPLYAQISFEGLEAWDVVDVLHYAGTYDSYCTKCKRDSTFQAIAPKYSSEFVRDLNQERLRKDMGIDPVLPPLRLGIHTVHACCTRQNAHTQDFLFFIDQEIIRGDNGEPSISTTIEKIGQQPSYGDIHLAQVKKYVHVLSKSQLSELSRAIGLASHDVGVGSYVYLRRIFEALVEEAHQAALLDQSWEESAYQRSRMSEKITILKSHLPQFLVEHADMYSLLSKGVHELSEEECLKHFETLRLAIELILDERLELREKQRKIATAKAALQKAIGKPRA